MIANLNFRPHILDGSFVALTYEARISCNARKPDYQFTEYSDELAAFTAARLVAVDCFTEDDQTLDFRLVRWADEAFLGIVKAQIPNNTMPRIPWVQVEQDGFGVTYWNHRAGCRCDIRLIPKMVRGYELAAFPCFERVSQARRIERRVETIEEASVLAVQYLKDNQRRGNH